MADTNIYYGSGIGVAGNIDIGGIGLSADSRLMVKTRAGLDELKAAKRVYDGMIVYCEADQTYHKCRVVWDDAFNIVSCSWTEVAIKSKEELESIIAHATTAAMEFKGATSILPTSNLNKGDIYKVVKEINVEATKDAEGVGFKTKIGDSIVYDGNKWFLIPSGDDIESNTTYELEGQKESSEVHFKVKPSDSTEETVYLDAYSQKEVNDKLKDYVTSKSIKETLNWITNVQSGGTPVEQANKASFADEASYAESAGSADTAGSAGTATKATQDINGNNIVKTYATKSEVAAKQDKLESGVNIKTINGQSLLDSGDLVLNADGSISTNPDWNQNDETKLDYIKNRTHYTKIGNNVYTNNKYSNLTESYYGVTEYKNKKVYVIRTDGYYNDYYDHGNDPLETNYLLQIVNNNKIVLKTIITKNQESKDPGSWSVIGNSGLMESGLDNGEYACMFIHEGEAQFIFCVNESDLEGFTNETEFIVSLNKLEIKQIDEHYIPNTIARKSEIAALTEDKVDKITGKGLSTNDYTDEDKQKLIDWKVPIIDFWKYLKCEDKRPTLTTYEQVFSDEIFEILDKLELGIGFETKEETHNGLYPILSITSDDKNIVRYCPIIASYYIADNGINYLHTIIKLSENSYLLINTPGMLDEEGNFASSNPAMVFKYDYIANKALEAEKDSNGNRIVDTYALNARYEGGAYESFIANDTCQATKNYSFSEGLKTTASGDSSHAEGSETIAKGRTSHAEGAGTVADGIAAHAEGGRACANGAASHAEGMDTIANGPRAHVEGYHTIASATDQHVQGKYNIAEKEEDLDKNGYGKYVHIVGNGEDDSKRSNAHTLDWDGNAWYAGEVAASSVTASSVTASQVAASSIKIGNTVFTEEQLMKILKFIETINVGGNN